MHFQPLRDMKLSSRETIPARTGQSCASTSSIFMRRVDIDKCVVEQSCAVQQSSKSRSLMMLVRSCRYPIGPGLNNVNWRKKGTNIFWTSWISRKKCELAELVQILRSNWLCDGCASHCLLVGSCHEPDQPSTIKVPHGIALAIADPQ